MLTFEAIRNVERDERENKKLQKLPDNFFDTVRDYLKKKEEMKDKSSLDALEIENAKNTVKRLLDMREKKVIEIAIMSSRTGLAAENLTDEEKRLFEQAVTSLKDFRDNIYAQMKKEPAETVYKVKKSMPDFVGPDMKNYSIRENDVISLPKDLADLLIKENIIEKAE
ncbi:MAG: DNA replication complex GINS family protein [Candidatus Aenigmarchaeota archaeon]|nr:DNA replication complex GINS family protein [Candidatus Aenigmarchaeota archaeon]